MSQVLISKKSFWDGKISTRNQSQEHDNLIDRTIKNKQFQIGIASSEKKKTCF